MQNKTSFFICKPNKDERACPISLLHLRLYKVYPKKIIAQAQKCGYWPALIL